MDKSQMLAELRKPACESVMVPEIMRSTVREHSLTLTVYDYYTRAREILGGHFPTMADLVTYYNQGSLVDVMWTGGLLCLEAMVDREKTPPEWAGDAYFQLISNGRPRLSSSQAAVVQFLTQFDVVRLAGVTCSLGVTMVADAAPEGAGSEDVQALAADARRNFTRMTFNSDGVQQAHQAVIAEIGSICRDEREKLEGERRELYDLSLWAVISKVMEDFKPYAVQIGGVVIGPDVNLPEDMDISAAIEAGILKANTLHDAVGDALKELSDPADGLRLVFGAILAIGAAGVMPPAEMTRLQNETLDGIDKAASDAASYESPTKEGQ
ncbi:MAG: hypothetical protein M0R06_06325 [Sphaerochaeta sp.]|jgi:hypothetical protein|nr:hypothetical protein [Sphaerochaeta sp.]